MLRMKQNLLTLVFIGFSSCTKLDPINPPVSHESELNKQEEFYKDKNILPTGYEYFGRNLEYRKFSVDDDMKKIDNDYDQYVWSKNDSNQNEKVRERYNDEERRERLDKIFGYTGPTANDEPENLERPCALDDWACMRKYFAANGKCKPAYGPIPDPLYQDIVTLFFSNANTTAVLPNLEIRGLSAAKITTFYVNKKTGNLVFAFDLPNFNVVVPRVYLRYRRTAKESIILAGFFTVNFRSSTFTTVIPKVPDLRLDYADSHIDIRDGLPPFFASPELFASADPDVPTGFGSIVGNLPVAIREGLLFESQFIAAHYIQKNICDFGLKLISV